MTTSIYSIYFAFSIFEYQKSYLIMLEFMACVSQPQEVFIICHIVSQISRLELAFLSTCRAFPKNVGLMFDGARSIVTGKT